MSERFNELVFQQLEKDRSGVVLDTSHAYGIIQRRLKTFWDIVCLTEGTHLESSKDILDSLVALAAIIQHSAETLKFLPDAQDSADDTYAKAQEINKELRAAVKFLCEYIKNHLIQLPQIQLGQKRFAVEVDPTFMQQVQLLEKQFNE